MPAIPVMCSHCGRSYSVDGSLVGRTARCKGCGQAFALTPCSESPGPAVETTAHSAKESGPGFRARHLALPERIGRFLVTCRLGSGAFGTVYRVTDPVLGREVALKVPRPGLLQSPQALERFLREARAAAQLRHPNIVAVFETGIDRGEHYIATEFIDGTTLAAAVGPAGIDPRRAAEIVAALAEALRFAHTQGIVHRDVKPANVMLDDDDRPHLMDFGLARIEGATGEKLTQAGAVVGTPAYMAPEQAAGGGAEANAASDQYSLGATLYELLTGRTPFSGPPEAVIYHLTHHDAAAPRTLRPEIPRELETICLKAMARTPERRYGSCQELADDLRRWLRGEPVRADRPGRIVAVRRWLGSHKVASGLAASAIVGFILIGTWAATSWWKPIELHPVEVQDPAAIGLLADSAPSVPPPKAAAPKPDPAPPLSGTEKPGASSSTVQTPSPVTAKVAEKAKERTPAAAPKSMPKSDPTLSYEQRITDAYRACKAGQPEKAEVLLAGCPAGSRGWEWYHCKRLCRFHLTTFQGHVGAAHCIAFSPDGKRLASGGQDGTVRIWEVGGPARDPLIGHGETVIRVAFTEDGKQVISVSRDKVIVFDIETGKAQLAPMPLAGLTAADISVDARWIAGGNGEGTIMVCDVATRRGELTGKSGRGRSIRDLAFSGDGREIAYFTTDGWALLHRGEVTKATGKRNRDADPQKGSSMRCLALSPDGRRSPPRRRTW